MAIAIYTYADPYNLPAEPYWDEIIACPFFCASQTLVNGLRKVYKNDFRQGRVTTVRNLVESLFLEWEGTSCQVKQHAHIDNVIANGFPQLLDHSMQKNIVNALIFNREEVFESIRILFELNINVRDILIDKLTPEQVFIVEVYKMILSSTKASDFQIKNHFSVQEIDSALCAAMLTARSDCNVSTINRDTVVIHGVHQFTPMMLRTIESISQYKKVILLFNYQPQYKNAYQTWIDIYNAFDYPIHSFDMQEFHPSLNFANSYQGNILADRLGKMINGSLNDIAQDGSYTITEFDNVTEFAGYIATMFAEAMHKDPLNPMQMMHEQIYAANSSVNDILKVYFPEQFGERQFLNYPLGHFFVAIANMWDPQNNEIRITDFNDIKECLESGILSEEYLGQLSTIFGKVSALFDGCTTIVEMQQRLKRVLRNKKRVNDEKQKEYLRHIAYYNVDRDSLEKLSKALADLEELAAYFYEDFESKAHNFRDFYRKLKVYLQNDVLNASGLDEEYTDIVRRVLERINNVEDIDASASFECLKATMSLYLVQETKPGKSANWIVRDFQQIDGDILRSDTDDKQKIYHFACLTDEDINDSRGREFPWPLNDSFFEVAQEPVDWKYQVYVKCRKEYKNFKRYALLYGLEFNRAKFKLSYIKRDGDRIKNPYSLLKILGVQTICHNESRIGHASAKVDQIQVSGQAAGQYTDYDYCRFRLCRYRFLMESIIEGTTVYKDSFLLGKYLEVLLENDVKEELEGFPISEIAIIDKLNEIFDDLKRYFPFIRNVNRLDIINNIRNRLTDTKNKVFPKITPDQKRYMMMRELFIHTKLSDPRTHIPDVLSEKFASVSADTVSEKLSETLLTNLRYTQNVNLWCQYCPNREFCAAFYS